MNTKSRNALGRGLSALLENANTDITDRESKPVGTVSEITISQIEANPFQPRTEFDDQALQELMESIKIHGIIQPITVRKMGYDRYQIISGERRTRASVLAGLSKIPAYVRVANDQEMLEMALIENIQREELNAIEIAISYKRLIEECELTQDQLAERVGKNKTTVNNYLRLLKLPEHIQLSLKNNEITMGHARAIINIDDPQKQQWMFEQMRDNGLSVRDVEKMARTDSAEVEKKTALPKKKLDVLTDLQKQLSDKLDTKISIKTDDKGRGAIKIAFRSQAEMKRLIDLFQ